MDVTGKVALITGGGTGVGRATALELARRGCASVVNYSRSRTEAEQTAAEVAAEGVKGLAVRADVAVDGECRDLVATTVRELGRLDILVNSAGTTSFIPFAELDAVSDEIWDRIMAVNLKGPFLCARAARDALTAGDGGEIVSVSSVAGIAASGSSIPYAASKAALNNLTVALARVFAPKVRVNAVAPGFITGRWMRSGFGDRYAAMKAAAEKRSPLGRVCDPKDVAEAIVSLITGSDLVTGQVLPVEGGALIGR